MQRVFRTIANIPFDQQFDPSNIAGTLQIMNTDASLNPKFDKLSIALDDNPDMAPDPENKRQKCSDNVYAGYTMYDPSIYQDRALVTICPQTLETFYSLQDIEN